MTLLSTPSPPLRGAGDDNCDPPTRRWIVTIGFSVIKSVTEAIDFFKFYYGAGLSVLFVNILLSTKNNNLKPFYV